MCILDYLSLCNFSHFLIIILRNVLILVLYLNSVLALQHTYYTFFFLVLKHCINNRLSYDFQKCKQKMKQEMKRMWNANKFVEFL